MYEKLEQHKRKVFLGSFHGDTLGPCSSPKSKYINTKAQL